MNASRLIELIREAVREELVDILPKMLDEVVRKNNMSVKNIKSSNDLSLKSIHSNRDSGYSDLGGGPKNDVEQMKEGMQKASNVLQWYSKTKKPNVVENKEFEYSDQDINKFISKTMRK